MVVVTMHSFIFKTSLNVSRWGFMELDSKNPSNNSHIQLSAL